VRGERFGLIRFGSRMDTFLPVGTAIKVAVGDRVKGGETILGELR
jgi:phosphatidylserine decarboxylase